MTGVKAGDVSIILEGALVANRKYTDAQRADAVRRIVADGESLAGVARDMTVNTGTVQRWLADAAHSRSVMGSAPEPATADEDREHQCQLERQLRHALERLRALESQVEELLQRRGQ